MKKKFFFCAFWVFAQCFFVFGQVKVLFKTVNFTPVNATQTHVFLAGDFNNWNPHDTAWELTFDPGKAYSRTKILPGGNYNFKVTRGSWSTVECNGTGNAIANRTLRLMKDTTIELTISGWQDNFAPQEKKHTASAQVHIISDAFEIPQLERQRRVWIYLPEGYAGGYAKYPVIYMQDGQNLFDDYTSAYGEWGVDEIMDKIPEGRQSIIVGIDHGGENRITEYDPFDSKYGKGQGAAYTAFLVKTLKPYIDEHYRTLRDAAHTTIAGSSMGGLISMYAALKYPEVFGNAGIFSPAFWVASPDIYRFAENQRTPTIARFYFVCGDAESDSMAPDMEKMAAIIRSKGETPENMQVVIVKGAKHNEHQWNGDFPAFYEWIR